MTHWLRDTGRDGGGTRCDGGPRNTHFGHISGYQNSNHQTTNIAIHFVDFLHKQLLNKQHIHSRHILCRNVDTFSLKSKLGYIGRNIIPYSNSAELGNIHRPNHSTTMTLEVRYAPAVSSFKLYRQ